MCRSLGHRRTHPHALGAGRYGRGEGSLTAISVLPAPAEQQPFREAVLPAHLRGSLLINDDLRHRRQLELPAECPASSHLVLLPPAGSLSPPMWELSITVVRDEGCSPRRTH